MSIPLQKHFDVIVIGAGPSGMMAAITCAESGSSVLLLEKKDRPGKKLLLTGHGRCNMTNLRIPGNFLESYHENARFLTSSFHAFPPEEVRELFQSLGVPSHEEDDGRIFPDSQQAATVCDALERALSDAGVKVLYSSAVSNVAKTGNDPEKKENFLVKTENDAYTSRAVILCTGGKSFPHTGSEGDGYHLAAENGHTVTALAPALAPILLSSFSDTSMDRREDCGAEFTLAGITLPDVGASLWIDGKKGRSARGDLLFTHQGVSGPAAMQLSRELPAVAGKYPEGKVRFVIDMLPDLREEEVEERLLSAMTENPNRHMKRLLCETFHLQEKAAILALSGETMDLSANEVRKEVRKTIVRNLKASAFDVEKCTPIDIAYVTRGGVNIKEISPKTMGSKIVEGLFFAGEVMDIDGISGGYNLQHAWASGRAAGKAASEYAQN
ncbi:MAG: NAD(P)/FAD-dependent oxidoreductase [Clostridiales bacterium]|nr:NAD(P)/FAD-dependent oxidoreductase [Clostridiales bacterium]